MTPKEEVYRKLRQWQKALSLTDSDTGLITTGASISRLQPKPNQNDLKLYEQVLERMLADASDRQAPLKESDRQELEALQQVLRLSHEDVADVEHRLAIQSAQSAQTVLPTVLPTVSPQSGNTPTTSPSSFNQPVASPAIESFTAESRATEIPSVKIPAAEIPSVEIPSTEIPSVEIPSSAGEVNPSANVTGVKGQMVNRRQTDPASPKSVSSPATEPLDGAAIAAKPTVDAALTASPAPPDKAIVVEKSSSEVQVKPDRAPLLITLGLLLPLLGLVGGIWLALRPSLGWNTVPADPKLAQKFVESGTQKNRQRQYAAAIQDFDQAIRLNGQNAIAFLNRGFAQHRMGRLNEAVDDYTQALTLDNRLAEAFNNRSHARFDQGRQDGALEDANRAIALQPKLAIAHLNMGNALFAQKKLDGAFQKFSETLQLNPPNPVAARAHNNQGNVFTSQKKFDAAVLAYSRAIQLDASYADALFNRAIASEQKGNRPGAINDFQAAANLYKAEGNPGMSTTSAQRAEQLQKNTQSI